MKIDPVNRSYYPYCFLLDGRTAFLIWYDGEPDGLYLDPSGLLPVFGSLESLTDYARQQGVVLASEEHGLLDLDLLKQWLGEPSPAGVHPIQFLDAWNLFADLSVSTGAKFDVAQELTLGIYDKLFWGCNLPAMTPEGEHYEPEWTPEELKIMADTLGAGLTMFRMATGGEPQRS